MELEGITRACPRVPLINRNTTTTQAHATASFFTRVPSAAESTFEVAFRLAADSFLALTFHRHFFLRFCHPVFANFQLHEICGINPGIARRAELPSGITDGLPQTRQ